MATLTCKCKKTCFTFAAARPRTALECCCCDCSNGVNWCRQQLEKAQAHQEQAKTSCVPTNTTTSSNTVPQLLHYIDNDIVAVKGEEYLRTMRLREKGATLRIYCGECCTHLIAVHPLYFENRVMIITNAFDNKTECWNYEGEPIVPEMRIQTKFWNNTVAPLPVFDHGPSYACDGVFWPIQSGILKKFAFPPCPKPRRGQSIQDIMQRLPTPIIAKVEERPLQGHMKVGMGWLTITIKNPFVSTTISTTTSKGKTNKAVVDKNKNKSNGIVFVGALAVMAVLTATIPAAGASSSSTDETTIIDNLLLQAAPLKTLLLGFSANTK